MVCAALQYLDWYLTIVDVFFYNDWPQKKRNYFQFDYTLAHTHAIRLVLWAILLLNVSIKFKSEHQNHVDWNLPKQ